MSNVGEMTLMSHFADAEHPEGIVQALEKVEQASEGMECRRSLANSAATLGIRKRILTGYVRGSFCMVLRLRDTGVISPIPGLNLL